MVDVDAELYERLQACEEQYTLHFAQQVRLTRDPHMLSALVSEVQAVEQTADTRGYAAVVSMAQRQAAHYEQERHTIVAALQAAGPKGQAIARLTRRASLLMHRYTRHFAGQARPTRDVGLLHEMVHDLRALHTDLLPLSASNAGVLQDYAGRWEVELQHIERSRQQGEAPAQAASQAGAANTLLQTYTTCCLSRRRLAVRPALLGRLCGELQRLLGSLDALTQQGLTLPHHLASLAALRKQLGAWHAEHAAATQAQRTAAAADRHAALAAELEDIFTAVNGLGEAGQLAGASVGPLCDRMEELELQLRTACDQAGPSGPDAELLSQQMVATDALCMLCQRYDAAAQAPN